MSDYQERRTHESRLRRIILLSADVAPDRVADYLRDLASKRAWRDIEQPLKEYASLVRHLLTDFVNYALGVLIENEEELDWGDFEPDRLGIRHALTFFPAAPVQGPFLALFRRNADEGLRLLHGLTNRATELWKRSMQMRGMLGTPLTPVPLSLALPTGVRQFWGDEHLYRWHRGGSTGPGAVVSALMALEMWLEEQLESGASAEDLFARVLEGSQSIAVLGACASVSLFAHERCLAAALPLVSHPRVWRMDLARRVHERSSVPPFSTRRTELFDKINGERSNRACRRADIRALIPFYLFGGEDLRARFLSASARFAEQPLFEFAEEQASAAAREKLADSLSHYAPMLDPAHYREVRDGQATYWQYIPPDHLVERAQAARASEANLAASALLSQWARSSIDSGTPAPGMGAAEAIDLARSFANESDFEQPVTTDLGLECMRLEAIAQIAAAALVADGPTLDAERLAWCRGVVIRAAASPRGGWVIEESHHPSDIKVSAARGLGALVAAGSADDEVRAALFFLVVDPQYQVVEAVFAGLARAWQSDPVLCWNALALALEISAVPRRGVIFGEGLTLNASGQRWLEDAVARYSANIDVQAIADIPDFPGVEDAFFVHPIVARAIKHIPVGQLAAQPPAHSCVLKLIDNLLDKTTAEMERTRDDHPERLTLEFEWAGFFMEWLACAGGALTADEESVHILDRVEAMWSECTALTKGLLRGFLTFRFGTMEPPAERSVSAWNRICGWVLSSPQVAALGRNASYPSDFDDTIELMVFVEHGRYWFKPEWAHAAAFEPVFARWASTVGTNYRAYAGLVTMLLATGNRFDAGNVLAWIIGITERSGDVRGLWAAHGNGERTAELLASLVRRSHEIKSHKHLLSPFTILLDELVASGVAHAARLRDELERASSA